MTEAVNGKASADEAVSRMKLGAIGGVGLRTSNGYIYEEAKQELRYPQSIKTFKAMSYDATIKAANVAIDTLVSKVRWRFDVPKDAPAEAVEAAEFLNYAMANMEQQTWREFINEVGSYRVFGYHVAEKIWKKVETGKWKGKLKWKQLATRSQDTVGEWVWDKNDPDMLAGCVQDLSYVNSDIARYNSRLSGKTEIEIPRNKFLLFRYDPKKNNPMGNSPLLGCYIPWKQKTIAEEYELIGLSRDLGGTIEIGVAAEYLAKAAENPAGPEAQNIEIMKQNAANLHAGDSTYIMKPIAYDDKGNELFTFELKGVQGSGKQFDLNAIINRKQNEILTLYLADVLKMGQDKVGSYSLSDTKTNLMAMGIQYHLDLITDVINSDLIPQTLAMNGWFLESHQMPFLTYEDLEDEDRAEFAKGVQQVSAVKMLARTPKSVAHVHRKLGFPDADDIEAMTQSELDAITPENRTGAAGGMDSGLSNGDGDSTSKGGDRSANNTSNK